MVASLPCSPEDLFRRLAFGGDDAMQLKLGFSHPDAPHRFFVGMPCTVALRAFFGLMGRSTPPPAVAGAFFRTTLQSVTLENQ